jgi:uncharacterized surface protein with fasciclin (FAS1) repeats
MKIIKFTFLLLIIGISSCQKKNEGTVAPTMDAFIKAEPTLSMFSKVLDKAGLESFKTGPGPFTWFAPNNDAFTAALITEDSLNRMTQGQANYLILYHLANASLNSENMIAINSTPRSSQLGAGSNQFYSGSLNNEIYINGSKVISKDNKVSNGYVHILNRLNTPPLLKGNIPAILASTGQHTLFIAALNKANLMTTLGSTAVFTVFAPTDAAMTAAGYTSTSIAAATVATLAAEMRYHYILNLRLFTNDLNKTSLPSTAAGSSSYITPSANGTKIKGKSNVAPANIIKPDILGTNGVVHVIDAVLKR